MKLRDCSFVVTLQSFVITRSLSFINVRSFDAWIILIVIMEDIDWWEASIDDCLPSITVY